MKKTSQYSLAIISSLLDDSSMIFVFNHNLISIEDFLIVESLAYTQACKKRYKCFKFYKKGLLK